MTLASQAEEMSPEAWAARTKRIATRAVEGAKRLGRPVPPELLTVANTPEGDLAKQRRTVLAGRAQVVVDDWSSAYGQLTEAAFGRLRRLPTLERSEEPHHQSHWEGSFSKLEIWPGLGGEAVIVGLDSRGEPSGLSNEQALVSEVVAAAAARLDRSRDVPVLNLEVGGSIDDLIDVLQAEYIR